MSPSRRSLPSARRLVAAMAAAVVLAAGLFNGTARAQSPPPPPANYFNDYAHLVSPSEARRLDDKLKRFDQETSTQVLVVVFAELPSASLEDFTVRAAQSWRVGRQKLDNGAVLFVFVKDRVMRLEVGYGLEGTLPDATAKRIIDDTITPAFRAGRFAGGLEAGIDAIMAATRGEYRAPARRPGRSGSPWVLLLPVAFIFLNMWLFSRSSRFGPRATYGRAGLRRRGIWWGGGPWMGGGFGGGGFGGGGFGGGGFSGGGGSFGGGGASGRW